MSYAPFVPLRVFSAYTMLDGAIEPKKVAKVARSRGFPAVAITDRNGLYGAMAFASACFDEGVQPIVGAMLAIARPGSPEDRPVIDWLALYAQDETGYRNLCHLVSSAHLDRPIEHPAHVSLSALEGCTEGLIVLTAGAEGALARLFAEGQADAANRYADRLQTLFGDRLYIELARRGDQVEEAAEAALIDLAYERDIPLVATNPACFAEPDFHEAHDVMLCIAHGEHIDSADRRTGNPQDWMKPAQAMIRAFEDLPEAVRNSLIVAQRCAYAPPRRDPILPSLAGDLSGEAAQLRADAHAGLEKRLAAYADLTEDQRREYFERLDYEVEVIVNMGFPGYFLIVADFIKWAKDRGIPVGPGRGSGAGSVVAWALTITDLDPLKLGLLFERFLNPERVSMPDFDIDFCETRRGEVIRYVQEKYGRDHVAQIITFGKLKARAVLRDTGRVLQMPYGQVDKLTKLVPNHPTDPWNLERALNGIAELAREAERDAQVARLFHLAKQLEGLPRHSSTHAAGVVIGDRPLSELVPLYRDPRSDMPVTQFDMKFVETAGLVKFDFLGLKTLSVLHKAVQMLEARGISIDLNGLALDDAKTYELLQRGETVGVFQLESEGMRRTLAQVKPTNFGDIIALVSLYRPGPMDNIPSFGARKNGREAIEYPHPLLEDILKETYGIIVYQEQVMQAAQVLAGYSLGEADLLRRAMGKKIKAEMDKQRGRFVEGAARNDIPAKKANELFDLIDKFAGYGFNKSHAAAYALLAYQTGWLKAHYPHEFYAASMCFDMHQTDKLNVFVDDMRRARIELLPPDVNASQAEFGVEPTEHGHAVRYALAGLKNVGEKAMQGLVAARERGGRFESLADFANRIDPALLNKRSLENLAAAGALDCFDANRAALYHAAEAVLASAGTALRNRESGQSALFGDDQPDQQAVRIDRSQRWSRAEAMLMEKEAFGFFFAAHPVAQYDAILRARAVRSYGDLFADLQIEPGQRRGVTLAALVEGAQKRRSRRGSEFVIVDLSDQSGQYSASCFEPEMVKPLLQWAEDSACVLIQGEFDRRSAEDEPRLAIRSAQPLDTLSGSAPMRLSLSVTRPDAFGALSGLLQARGGGRGEVHARVTLEHARPGETAELSLGRNFRLDGELVEHLEAIEGLEQISLQAISGRLHLVK